MNFAAHLKALRKERGLSVQRLAEKSGVSASYLWQVESARRPNPSGEVLARLAHALGVNPGSLLGEPEELKTKELKEVSRSLQAFVRKRGKALGVRSEDIEMLKLVQYRGNRPDTVEQWELLYLFLKHLLSNK